MPRRAKDGASTDGLGAHQFHLIRSRREQSMPAEVRARRDELERAVAQLRESKNESTDDDEHSAKLEPLLLELARLYAALEDSKENR